MPARIVIIGAGFSGAVLAVQLLRQARTALDITLVNASGRMARGLAYGTASPQHLLNVPAARMSALADDPGHFLRWCRRTEPRTAPEAFVSRERYGAYLADLLDAAATTATTAISADTGPGPHRPSPTPPVHRLHRLVDQALAVRPARDGWTVLLARQPLLPADTVVLAFGHFTPALPLTDAQVRVAGAQLVPDPWRPDALAPIGPDDPVLLIGTGLTALDVTLSLQTARRQAPVIACSRRGLPPWAQPEIPMDEASARRTVAEVLQAGPCDRVPELLRRLRQRLPPRAARPLQTLLTPQTPDAAAARSADPRSGIGIGIGIGSSALDWRALIAALRPDTVALWQGLPEAERRRFLRHLRPWWDAGRHLCAPVSHQRWRQAIAQGRVQLLAARVVALERAGADLVVSLAPRGAPQPPLRHRVRWIINCTGPASDPRRTTEPLVRQLLADGLIQADALGLGITTAPGPACRPLGRDGRTRRGLHAIGPLLRADRWEATAVPELRTLARDLAGQILADPRDLPHPDTGP